MKIAFASTEVVPYAKTGGLGDVIGALPKVLQQLGHEVKIFLPNYSQIDHSHYYINHCYDIGEIPIRVNGKICGVQLFMAHLPGSSVEVYFIDYPPFYHRGKIYTEDPDEDERFILLCKAVIESLQRLQWIPDVINCNDWQTGLIPLYLKDNYSWDKLFANTATVITIHNIGYQGRFPKSTLYKAEVREALFFDNGPVEVYGRQLSFLKAAISYADCINTVSETYAAETTTANFGEGLEGALVYRINDFRGILNGVDYSVWNPEIDSLIPFPYSINDLSGKLRNKQYLLKSMNLPFWENVPLIGIVSRLVDQKGFDIFAQALNDLMKFEAQWLILGSGETVYVNMLNSLHSQYPHKVGVYIGHNEELAHLIEAGADIFLMPSRYEPCGLNQIYSLKYGTVPVVRKTGGLADTVLDWNEHLHYGREIGTGYSFHDYTAYALTHSVARAIQDFHNKPVWHKIMMNGMTKDYSWEVSAKKYVELYKQAVKNRKA